MKNCFWRQKLPVRSQEQFLRSLQILPSNSGPKPFAATELSYAPSFRLNPPPPQQFPETPLANLKTSLPIGPASSGNHFLHFNNENDSDSPNKEEQERISNLGTVIDELHTEIPDLVGKSLPKHLLLPHILLRICPSHFDQLNSYLPNIKGHVSYYATCKALRLFLTSLVLNPNVKLHILSLRTSRLSDPQCVYPDSTKIFVRWTTCPEGCSHLSLGDEDDYSTAKAKLGSHRWSRIDTEKYLEQNKPHNWSLALSLADLTKGLIGLTKEEVRLERVILGVFIFELNDRNDQIIAHTIEDMDVVERREEQGVDGKLRVC